MKVDYYKYKGPVIHSRISAAVKFSGLAPGDRGLTYFYKIKTQTQERIVRQTSVIFNQTENRSDVTDASLTAAFTTNAWDDERDVR